ncbi:Rhodanese-like protein [Ascobolus immersus RN42]|uniref:M-phase inducer phosphatase n=1 Tax=Ascobolus immersus RN42 TaxID=1160509 RepID=A0A3N4I2B1_ASCIM|nr:Rhodanese-like protein [Ascobolus immersus RN42]
MRIFLQPQTSSPWIFPTRPQFQKRTKDHPTHRSEAPSFSGSLSVLTPPSRKKSASFARPALPRNRSLASKSSSPSLFATPKKSSSSIFANITVPGTPDLEEIFNTSSPIPQRKSGNSPNLDTPVPRLRPLVSSHKSADASPIGMLNRKAVSRPKMKARRTLSMFETADEVVKGKKDLPSPVSSISESSSESTILPSFTHKDDTIRRINKATMVQVLEGQFKEQYDQCYIVDCRFEYEYQGGHIEGAININSNEALEETFINTPKEGKTLIIFHCEYSAHRAPRMANQLRSRDRQQNMHRYPELYYPEVYILEGGYSSFFKEHKEHCYPQKYVEMNDVSHKQTCEKEMGKFRRNTKFARAQTFHFGSVANTDNGSPSVARRVPVEGAISKIGGPKLGHPYPRQHRDSSSRRAATY